MHSPCSCEIRWYQLELQAERERGRMVREETIEECAGLADIAATVSTGHEEYDIISSGISKKIAAAIRDLSRAPEGGKDG